MESRPVPSRVDGRESTGYRVASFDAGKVFRQPGPFWRIILHPSNFILKLSSKEPCRRKAFLRRRCRSHRRDGKAITPRASETVPDNDLDLRSRLRIAGRLARRHGESRRPGDRTHTDRHCIHGWPCNGDARGDLYRHYERCSRGRARRGPNVGRMPRLKAGNSGYWRTCWDLFRTGPSAR